MKLLLKNTILVNADGQTNCNILIENDKISQIGSQLKLDQAEGETRDLKGCLVFPGFIDMHVHLREPGQEAKETLLTGLTAAVHGGITAVCSMPNTTPVIDNEVFVKFLIDKAWEIGKARLYPIGSITKGSNGLELSEMVSMIRAGAVSFSDDGHPVEDMQVLRRALQYIQPYNKPLILHCENHALSNGGVMNEGRLSTVLGLAGIHRSSEETSIAQSIEVARYFGRIHIAHVSTKGSVELIRLAKQRAIPVTAETAPHYFSLTEESIGSYNTNAKMNPPLRTEEDRRALIEGLRDGTIDAIATDHAPHTVDDKNREFDLAAFGIIGLETAVMLTFQKLFHEEGFPLERITRLWSTEPSAILGLNSGHIAPGTTADLTIVSPDKLWTIEHGQFLSKSKNSPFVGLSGKGRAVMTLVRGEIVWEEKQGSSQ